MPRSTGLRIALAYSTAFALIVLGVGAAVYRIAHHALERELDDRISAEMSFLVSEYRHEGERELLGVLRSREQAGHGNYLSYALFTPDGRRLAGTFRTRRPAVGWQNIAFEDPDEGLDDARAFVVDIAPERRLVVAADWDTLDDADNLILLTLAATLASVFLIGTIGAIAISAFLRARIAMISGSVEAITAGDLAQRIPLSPRGDEFDRLGGILNRMLDRTAELLENLQQVSEDIAHDLRLPLTRLRAHLERGLATDDMRPAIEQAIDQADDVLALFAAILRLSEIESGELRQSFRTVDLTQLVQDITVSYVPVAEDGGRSLWFEISVVPPVLGNRELLAQALINLLENALTHTPTGSRVGVLLEHTEGGTELTVVDNGLGVPATDHYRILQRFVRLQPSRQGDGHGLGLSLVRAIAHVHGALPIVGDGAPGLRVTLKFRPGAKS